MTQADTPALWAETLDANALLSLADLCRSCNVDSAWILQLVEYGAIEPVGTPPDWKFSVVSVTRVAKAKRLGRDLELTPAGVAMVLDLLEQIEDLRAQLTAARSLTQQ